MLLPKGTYIYIGYLVSSTIDTNTLIHISTTYAMNNQPIIDLSNSICESKLPSEDVIEVIEIKETSSKSSGTSIFLITVLSS